MNRIYRLVWDHNTASFKAVTEFARGFQRGGKLVCGSLLLLSGLTPALAAEQAKITVAGGNTKVFQAPNGVQVIDIETANQAGVSHNQFHDYNVSSSGLILNNNSPLTQVGSLQSQLGGQIVPNQNLVGEASVIINEVVSPNRSTLQGYTEVVGGTADVVVANPYGITCNGCGFINSDRVTLSTGRPELDSNGRLKSLQVEQGDIHVGTQGLDASRQQILDLVARNLTLDGQINANDLQITAGSNEFDYDSRSATAISGSGEIPSYAIDSTVFGGMYANRIKLVATEAGVGVRMSGEAAASGDDFIIDASGKVQILNKVSAERNIQITHQATAGAGDDAINLSGSNAELAAKGNIQLTGSGSAGITLDEGKINAGGNLNIGAASLNDSSSGASRFAAGELQVELSGDASISGSLWGAGDSQNMTASSISLQDGQLYSGSDDEATDRSLNIAATGGDLQLVNSSLTAPTQMNLSADAGAVSLDSNSSIQAGNHISVTVAQSLDNAGQILGQTDISLQVSDPEADLNNSGTLQATDALVLGDNTGKLNIVNQSGGVILADSLKITAGSLDNAGTLQASAGSQIDADNLTNNGEMLLSTTAGGNATIDLNGGFNNLGQIQSAGDLTLTVDSSLDNSGTLLALHDTDGGNGSLTVSALTLNNSGTMDSGTTMSLTAIQTGAGTSFSNSGTLQALGNIELDAGNSLYNSTTGQIIGGIDLFLSSAATDFSLNNHGLLQADNNLSLGSSDSRVDLYNATYDNGSGLIYSGNLMEIQGTALDNLGVIQAGALLTLNLDNQLLNRADGWILGLADLQLTSTAANFTLDNAGLLQSNGNMTLQTGSSLTNTAGAQLLAAGELTLTSSQNSFQLDNAGLLQADGNVTLGAADSRIDLYNDAYSGGDGLINSGGNLEIQGDTLVNLGVIQADNLMSLNLDQQLDNRTDGWILGLADLQLTSTAANFTLDNAGLLQSNGNMTLQTGSSLTNTAGAQLLAAGELTLTSSQNSFQLDNAGLLQADGNVTLGAADSRVDLYNDAYSGGDGLINSGGSLDIQGDTLVNLGVIQADNLMSLNLDQQLDNRTDGWILGLADLQLTSTAANFTLDNAGLLQSNGNMTLQTGSSLTNIAGAQLLAAGELTLTSSQNSFQLDNAGLLQADGNLTLGETGHQLNLTNASYSAGDGLIYTAATLSLSGITLQNEGRIQAATGSNITATSFSNGADAEVLLSTVAGADSTLDLSGNLDNQGLLQSAGGLDISTTGSLNNSGSLISQGGSDSLALSTSSLDNSGELESAGSLSLVTTGGTLDNSGQIHGNGSLSLTSAGSLSNSGDILGDAAVTLSTGQSSITLANSGRIQSGTTLNLGASSHLFNVNNLSAGVLYAGSRLNLTGGSLNNQGKIYANSGINLSLSSLTNGSSSNSSALIFGAMNTGNSSISVSGSLNNYGAIHSNDDFSISAVGLYNSDTGGLSSLQTLALTATGSGDIDNYGALYAGSALTLTATGDDIYNRAGTGTIDSSGDFSSNSAGFTNNHTVVVNGDIDITTTSSFKNETTIDGTTPSKTLGGASATGSKRKVGTIYEEDSLKEGADIYVWDEDFTRTESLNGSIPSTKAQIIANGAGSTLSIDYGNSGSNYLAVISAPTVNISGTGTFTNEDLTLYKYTYTRRWISVYDSWVGDSVRRYWARTDSSQSGWDKADSGGNGDEYNDYYPGDGWFGMFDSEGAAKTKAIDGAILKSTVVVDSFGAGIFASNFNFSGGTLNNIGSPWPNSESKATAGDPTSGSVDSQNQSGTGSSDASQVSGGSSNSGSNLESSLSGGSMESSLSGGSMESSLSGGSMSTTLAGSSLSFAGLDLTLPSNPNGYFVISQDPEADYLVETNPLFLVGSNFVSSHYLAERYGVNPDDTQRRLGDASYEAYLVRQQLINQFGSNLITGYGDEASQMQRLMDQAVNQGQQGGFVWGQPLTPEQVDGLTEDIVWMVEVVVNGETVLAPRVYLAPDTREMIATGATISADNLNVAGEGLNNTGGTLEGRNSVTVDTRGDITNTSGTIKGGNVDLTSREGSIINQTYSEGHGNDKEFKTSIGKTAGIQAGGNLKLDAKKNITVLGADVSAKGDAELKAGENVTFDTIVDKTTRTRTSSSNDALNSSSYSSTTTTETHIGSSLSSGGKLKINSGSDTVIGGSDVVAKGGLEVNAGGDFRVEARQDKTTTHSESTRSGMGVGGGMTGSQTTVTDSFRGSNKGSTIQVGDSRDPQSQADLNITAGGTMVLQGSKMDVSGNADINAKQGIQILDGLDEEHSTTTTRTTTFMKMEDGGRSANSSSGDGSAQASANDEHNLKLQENSVTTDTRGKRSSVSSQLNVGGDLSATTEGELKIRGSQVEADNIDLNAGDIRVEVGRNEEWSSHQESRNSVGLYIENEAETGAQGQAGGRSDAQANANTTLTTGARTETESSNSYDLTHSKTGLKSRGDMNLSADNKMTFQGAELESGGDMTLQATDIENRAAEDIHQKSSQSSSTTRGVYLSGEVSADANNNPQGISGAEGGAEGSAGLRQNIRQASETEGSTHNVTNSFKSGGDFSRTAENRIIDEGTEVESGGNINQSARVIEDREVHDSRYSSKSSSNEDARIGLYSEADAKASNNPLSTEKPADAGTSEGFKASYETETSSEYSRSDTAVTSRFKAKGNINSHSDEKTSLVGTEFEAGGDVTIDAGELEYRAAQDSSQSSKSGHKVDAEGKIGTGDDAKLDLNAEYESQDSDARSTRAREGGLSAGGNINITTRKGDVTLEGTQLESGSSVTVNSAGGVNLETVRDTTQSHDSNTRLSVEVSASKDGASLTPDYESNREQNASSQVRGGSIKADNININASE